MTQRRRVRYLSLSLLVSLLAGAASATPTATDFERLAAAVERHPEDPDLRLAWIRAQRERGELERALVETERFLERWPGERPQAERLCGQLLYELGRDTDAITTLDRYLERTPNDASAHFYRALALRRSGRRREAERDFAEAARLEPALRSDSLVLRGLDRLAQQDARGAQALIEEALAVDPGSELALDARALAEHAIPDSTPPIELSLLGGLVYDSNVTLDSGLEGTGLPHRQSDPRALWSAGVLWRPVRRENLRLSLGYRYDQAEQEHLDTYDVVCHLAYASLLFSQTERVAVRLDGRFGYWTLGHDDYLHAERIEPNLFYSVGPNAGVLRAYGSLERKRFADDPSLPSLERDALVYGVGGEHQLPLRILPGAWAVVGGSFQRTDTEAERDAFGFAGAFDHDRWSSFLRVRMPLFAGVEATGTIAFAQELYKHRNVLDFLTDNGVGTSDPSKRRDRVFESRLALSRPVGRGVSLEVAYRGLRRASNVDLYDYERHIVGFYVRALVR